MKSKGFYRVLEITKVGKFRFMDQERKKKKNRGVRAKEKMDLNWKWWSSWSSSVRLIKAMN